MNKSRRKRIQEIKDQLLNLLAEIEEIKDEEQEAYDNLPESLQKGKKMSEAINNLDSAYSSLEEVTECLEEATQ